MVVTQNDDQWKGRIGDTIRHFFLDYQYGLPQPEARNDLAHINVAGFSDMFRSTRTSSRWKSSRALQKAVTKTTEDQWAAPQRYIKISAPDIDSWVALFDKQKEVYQQWFDKVERERILTVFRPSKDEAIANAIAKKFGFGLDVPQGFYIAKSEPTSCGFARSRSARVPDIVIYQTPIKDTLQFETRASWPCAT